MMQELDEFDYRIKIITESLEKYISFKINNNLFYIDNFQFLSYSWGSFVKNLGKDDFKHLSQEFGSKKLDLDVLIHSYPYDYISGFKKLKKNHQVKINYSSLTNKEFNDKDYEHVIRFKIHLKWKRWEVIITST